MENEPENKLSFKERILQFLCAVFLYSLVLLLLVSLTLPGFKRSVEAAVEENAAYVSDQHALSLDSDAEPE